jgi:hypothetical protein
MGIKRFLLVAAGIENGLGLCSFSTYMTGPAPS